MKSEPWIRLPPIRGIRYKNTYCADCWEEGKINDERIEIDHIKEIKDGGDKTKFTNLRSLCHKHHNRKTHNSKKLR